MNSDARDIERLISLGCLIHDQVHTHLLLCQLDFLQGLEIWTFFQALNFLARRTMLDHTRFLPWRRSYGPVPNPGFFFELLISCKSVHLLETHMIQMNKVWTSQHHAKSVTRFKQTKWSQNVCLVWNTIAYLSCPVEWQKWQGTPRSQSDAWWNPSRNQVWRFWPHTSREALGHAWTCCKDAVRVYFEQWFRLTIANMHMLYQCSDKPLHKIYRPKMGSYVPYMPVQKICHFLGREPKPSLKKPL